MTIELVELVMQLDSRKARIMTVYVHLFADI
jgi:hypothetical protein